MNVLSSGSIFDNLVIIEQAVLENCNLVKETDKKGMMTKAL
jgi:hypothetical protein